MTHIVKSRSVLLLLLVLLLVPALPAAADVTVGGTVNFSSLDGSAQDDDHTVNGVFTVNGNLTVQGSINCNDVGAASASACSMKFVVSGDVTMLPGSALFAENRAGSGNGGNIIIQAGGNVTMQSPSGILLGAKISASRTTTSGTATKAGDITISAGGTTSLQAGTAIWSATSDATAGTITINGAGVMTIAGLVAAGPSGTVATATKYSGDVLSGGTSTATGGTIRITSTTHTQPAIVVTGDAVVVTQGGDPGTGPVSLEGCDVRVLGLVASISRDGFGARAVVRSGTSITVDGRDVNRPGPTSGRFGVIRASATPNNTNGNGNNGNNNGNNNNNHVAAPKADLFAQNDISILGPDPALSSVYSVSSNSGSDGSGGNNGNGNNQNNDPNSSIAGAARVISTAGAVTASGNAVSTSGIDGGSITVASKNDSTLNGATLKASGAQGSGQQNGNQQGNNNNNGKGGAISIRSHSGAVAWQNGVGDVRPTGSSVAASQRGTIVLTYCTSVSTSGTSFPTNGPAVGPFPTQVQSCSPAAPSLPAGEPVLPTCNRPPVAANDNYTVAEGGTLNVPAPGVLTNDSDPDGDPITAVLVTGPAHASSFALNANGSFTYVHDGSETTSDSFTYRASDGSATSNLATVNINVTPVNDVPFANNDTATVAEGGTINMAAPGVLANDTDPDGPSALTAILVTGPAHASSFVLNPNGSYIYVHDGSETTSDSFTYKASDSVATSNTATVSITITPVNDAPVANNDTYSVAEGGTLNQSAPGVLGNDTDSDSPTLTAVLVSGPAHASSFALNANGSFSYVHDGSETTSDSFTYRANDGSLNSNIATVNITITPVNDAPVAVNDGPYNVPEGGTLNIASPGVLANDTDVDSPTLTAVLVSGPAHASSFALNANGSFTYVHDGSETLTDSFTYRANDGSLNSNIATVSITITPVNDAPVAANDAYSVAEGGTLNTPAPGVLGNDTDPDSPVLTAALVSGPAHASSFALNADGSFTYVHDGSETTTDSFTYRANDGSLNSNIATVTITISPVNDAPVAVNDAYAVNEGGTINAVAPGVLGNDTDVDSPTLTAVLVSGPTHAASFALNADGSFTYVHDGSETTSDVFTYKASDGLAFSNIATVTITVTPVNDAPVVTAGGTLTFTEGDPATVIDNSITISDNDSPNLVGATVAITGNYASGQDGLGFANTANITGSFNAGTGVLTLTGTDTVANYEAALRSVTFNNTSTNPSTLQRTVTWQVDDGGGVNNLSAPVTSTINVVAVNSAPQLANGSTIAYTENDPATVINSVITVTDADSANLTGATVQITSGYNSAQDVLSFTPFGGISGSFNSGTGTLTLSGSSSVANYQTALRNVKYTNTSEDPATASRTVVFHVTDGTDASNTVSSTINVTAVNDAPTATAFSGLPAQAGIPITYPVGKLGGTDVEAGTTVTVDTTPINLVNGSVTLNADGSFTFTPTPQSAGGTASFQYRVADNGNPAPGLNSTYVTVSFNVAGPAIYFVKAAGAGNCTLGNECTLTTALAFGAASANIFISDAASHTSGPITLNTGGSIIGQGIIAPSFDSIYGIVAPAQGTLAPRPAVNQARPTIVNSPITLGTNSTAAGFNMSNNSGDTLIASSKSGLLVKDMDITSTAGSGTNAIDFTNSSGLFTLGTITNSAGGGGVNFTGTTSGSTVTFGNISTTSGNAVTVTTSGATNFSFADVTSTTGQSVSVNTATGSYTFHAINAGTAAGGPLKGVTITALTGAGSFTVNGTGTTAGSGGTIQKTQAAGVALTNAANVSLKNMNFINAATVQTVPGSSANCGGNLVTGNNLQCVAAINMQNATNASIDRIFINGSVQIGINGNGVNGFSLTNSEVRNAGDEVFESGLLFQNLSGTVTLTNDNLHDNAARQMFAENLSGTMNLTATGTTFGPSPAATGAQGLLLEVRTTTTGSVSVSSSTFTGNAGGTANAFQMNDSDNSNYTVTVSGSSFTNNAAGIVLALANGASLTYDINNNPVFTGNQLQAISIAKAAASTGTLSGKITNNTIGTTLIPGSACAVAANCIGISLTNNGGGTLAATATGNDIRQVTSTGFRAIASNGTGTMQLKISGNTIAEPVVATAGPAINVNSGAASADTTSVCADISGNTISGVWDANNFGSQILVRNRFAGTTLRLPGFAGPGNSTAAVQTFLSGQNGGASVTATINANVFGGGAACATP
jgi:VCBS repeat-containing protein